METWRDIVTEMRSFAKRVRVEIEDDVVGYVDRIEAACLQLEKAYNNAVSADARHCLEIVKLRRALEPVMNACEEDKKCDAVREAQAIMKGDEP